MKTLYEIWWFYPHKGQALRLQDYITCFANLWRHQVISVDRSVLEKTVERLRFVSPSDYDFEIRACGTGLF